MADHTIHRDRYRQWHDFFHDNIELRRSEWLRVVWCTNFVYTEANMTSRINDYVINLLNDDGIWDLIVIECRDNLNSTYHDNSLSIYILTPSFIINTIRCNMYCIPTSVRLRVLSLHCVFGWSIFQIMLDNVFSSGSFTVQLTLRYESPVRRELTDSIGRYFLHGKNLRRFSVRFFLYWPLVVVTSDWVNDAVVTAKMSLAFSQWKRVSIGVLSQSPPPSLPELYM